MRFSERMGFRPVRLELQKDSMDDALRASLWSGLLLTSLDLANGSQSAADRVKRFTEILYLEFFKWPIDKVPTFAFQAVEVLRKWFFDANWSEAYDFLECCIALEGTRGNFGRERAGKLTDLSNQFLSRELSAYRIVAGQIVPLTNESEIQSVNEAVDRRGKFASASDHIQADLLP